MIGKHNMTNKAYINNQKLIKYQLLSLKCLWVTVLESLLFKLTYIMANILLEFKIYFH